VTIPIRYFVVSSEETAKIAEVEVVIKTSDGVEKALTRLLRGQLFGQKFFLTKITVSETYYCDCNSAITALSI